MKSARVSPPNSIIFITDLEGGDVPVADRPNPIMFTESCISVTTLMEYDGETQITLTPLSECRRDDPAAFDGRIDTPTGHLTVTVVAWDIVLQDHSGSPRTRVVIWTNHPREPDEIVIGFERADA